MGEHAPNFAEPGWAYRKPDNEARQRIADARPPSIRAVDWPSSLFAEDPIGFDGLSQELARIPPDNALIVSLSHDQYISIAGGVQNCVGDEQQWAINNGVSYLHLCPNAPLPLLGKNNDVNTTLLIASVDGRRLGLVSIGDVLRCIADVRASKITTQCVVHHVLGFAPEHIALLHQACGDTANPMLFWVHDLFTLCPSIHLLRNGAAFCHGPDVSSQACMVCHAGADRIPHLERFKTFFDATRPLILAPSTTILDFWHAKGGYANVGSCVVPPCGLAIAGAVPQFRGDRPLRVAFLGNGSYEKGWSAFESLVRWHSADPRYQFFQFSWAPTELAALQHIPVTVTRSDRMAMVNAVKAAGIDVVINWSRCYESFSFTAHEALAAGAYVIARRGAGHVEHVLRGAFAGSGCVVKSENELQALFVTDEVFNRVSRSTRSYAVLSPGIGAGSILTQSWKGERKSA